MTPAQRRVKVWRPQGFEGVEVEIFENVQNYVDPKSVLDEYHFNVNFRGQARVTYAGARHDLRYHYPLVMVQQPGELYAADARGEAMSGWNLCLYENGMRRVMEALELPEPLPHFREMLVPASLNGLLAARLGDAIAAFDLPATRLERESKLLSVLHLLLSTCGDTSTTERQAGREHRAVGQVKETLNAHFATEVSLEFLAQLTGLSQGYLIRTFKLEVGVTPHAYQLALRVERAKTLLASGVDVAQVAFEMGFVDQSHLNHVFRKYVQTTPGRFRQDSLGDIGAER